MSNGRKTYAPQRGVRTVPPAARRPDKPKPNDYLAAAVRTAPREQLMLMLIDGAIRATERGRDALPGELGEGVRLLARAQQIVAELMTSLRPDIGQSYARLVNLYEFVFARIADSAARRDPVPLEGALKVLRDIRDLWMSAIEAMNEQGRPPELAHHIQRLNARA